MEVAIEMELVRSSVGADTIDAVLKADAATAVPRHRGEITHFEARAARNILAARNSNTGNVGTELSRLVTLIRTKLLLEGGILPLNIAEHRRTIESGRTEIASEHVAGHKGGVGKSAASCRGLAIKHGRRVGMKVHELHSISEHCSAD